MLKVLKPGFHVAVRYHKVLVPLACTLGTGFRITWKPLFKVPVPLVAVASATSNYMETTSASGAGSRSRDNRGAANSLNS